MCSSDLADDQHGEIDDRMAEREIVRRHEVGHVREQRAGQALALRDSGLRRIPLSVGDQDPTNPENLLGSSQSVRPAAGQGPTHIRALADNLPPAEGGMPGTPS